MPKFDGEITQNLSWLNKNLLLSFSLFFCTYSIVGWTISKIANHWATVIAEQDTVVSLLVQDNFLPLVIKLLILLATVFVSLILSNPWVLITFVLEESINSDLKAFIAILFWSIVLVFVFCSFDYFSHLLVIISSNILLRLDLQKLKYKDWQILIFSFIVAFTAFCLGFVLFDFFSPS